MSSDELLEEDGSLSVHFGNTRTFAIEILGSTIIYLKPLLVIHISDKKIHITFVETERFKYQE